MTEEDVRVLAHELQVHQIELEIQNEELRKVQLNLEESRNNYVDLYDFAPVGYVTLNQKGEIIEANLTSTKLLGIERSHLINTTFASFVDKEYSDIFYFYLKNIFEKKIDQSCELQLIKTNKEILQVQLHSIFITYQPDGGMQDFNNRRNTT